MVTIRHAGPADVDELVRVINAAYRVEDFFVDGDRTNAADVRARMTAPGAAFLVIDGGAPGSIAASVHATVEPLHGHFGLLAVDPARQARRHVTAPVFVRRYSTPRTRPWPVSSRVSTGVGSDVGDRAAAYQISCQSLHPTPVIPLTDMRSCLQPGFGFALPSMRPAAWSPGRRGGAVPLMAFAACLILAPGAAVPSVALAQDPGSLRVTVRAANARPIAGAQVRADSVAVRTDENGEARLVLQTGVRRIIVTRFGYAPDSAVVAIRSGTDTAIVFILEAHETSLAAVVVSATRSERRIEDDPVRVEVLDAEEVVEKLLMTPGDITMMLNETSGLRVQVTSPSLGGATVRVQGLRGRYTQILSDGLPLYGGQTGGLGLLQIPPMDLGGVEVIKGVASALYGGTALGGVVNLQSRRPTQASIRDFLINQTSLGGTDGVLFIGNALGQRDDEGGWSYTLLGGAHAQDQKDRDSDGWTDLPGYARGVLRPRVFWSDGTGSTAMLTAGTTFESRNGGTMPDGVAPNGLPYSERLRTRRFDAGGTYRGLAGSSGLVNLRGSYSTQRHRHDFGGVRERDRHETWFGEAAWSLSRGVQTWVAGAAVLGESFAARDVDGFDFSFTTPGVFAQVTTDAGTRLSVTGSVRADWHSEYGTFASPRLSVLYRLTEPWTVRASVGSGFFAPTPFTEETEVVGLSAMRPSGGLVAERARGGSVDLGGQVGSIELNLTAFGSVIGDPIGVRDALTAVPRVELVNLGLDTRAAGGELLARWHAEPLRVTLTYTYVLSTEADAETGERRTSPLTPRHQAGLVASYEREGEMRAGVEVYYTGRQRLDDDPYREQGRPYLHIGALVERAFGSARLFVNAENLLDVRQTDWDPLVRPFVGKGGRWTNDVWAPLDGFVVNAGVRWSLGAGH